VVNASEAAWLTNEAFGARCVFEADVPVVRSRPELQPQRFTDLGVTLAVLEPGRPSGLYHAESNHEDFLVLTGECLLLVEGKDVLLMVGARTQNKTIVYPDSELARSHGAGAAAATSSAAEAYTPFPHWSPGRPASWSSLPWPVAQVLVTRRRARAGS
jgi:hypothetical protein